MLKLYRQIVAYLLLVFLPMQAFAAANMLVCHGMMQAKKAIHSLQVETQMQVEAGVDVDTDAMPCHSHQTTQHTQHDHSHQSACQSGCASACVSMCSLVAFPSNIASVTLFEASQLSTTAYFNYASITLPNPHRPPIFLI